MRKMTVLYKISYSALFIALGIILSRFFAGWNLFGLSFLKISLTMSVVFFSTFYLGPLYGTIISFSIDLFGALLIPQGGSYDFLYSIPSIIQGFVPYFIYVLLRKGKVDSKFPWCLGVVLLLFNAFIFYFVLSNDTFKLVDTSSTTYTFTPLLKGVICSVSLVLSILFYVAVIIFKKKFQKGDFNKYYNIYLIAISIFITYILVKTALSAWIFNYRLNYTYEFIFGTRALTGFFSSFVHIILVSIALNVSLKTGIKGSLIEKKKEETKEEEDVRE